MSASPVQVGDVQREDGIDWVVVTPPVIAENDDGSTTQMVGASRVRVGSSAHNVHSADPRIAASFPGARR